MPLQRVDEMASPPIVGQRYLVPCVYVDRKIEQGRGGWTRRGWPPEWDPTGTTSHPYQHLPSGWYPILGPRHEDHEHLGFGVPHWHYDLRFLSLRQHDRLSCKGKRPLLIFGNPLQDYGGLRGPEYRPRLCLRSMEVPDRVEDLEDLLAPHYAGNHLRGPCKVCPHRGVPLASMPVESDGTVTCPAHGLRWDVTTGRLVRRRR